VPYRGSKEREARERAFPRFIGDRGLGPSRRPGTRRRRAEASLITPSGVGGHAGAQSNKLVGITRSRGGRRGGGVAAHHRPSSPPISGALSRAGSFAHKCNARTCIFHAGTAPLAFREIRCCPARGGRHDTVTLAWPRRNPPRAPITICGASGDFIGQAD